MNTRDIFSRSVEKGKQPTKKNSSTFLHWMHNNEMGSLSLSFGKKSLTLLITMARVNCFYITCISRTMTDSNLNQILRVNKSVCVCVCLVTPPSICI